MMLPAPRSLPFIAGLIVACALLPAAQASQSVWVVNLTSPTSAAFDAANNLLWISQLNGMVLVAPSPLVTSPPSAQAALLALNLSGVVADYGYHGLASLAVARGFLFLAYQQVRESAALCAARGRSACAANCAR